MWRLAPLLPFIMVKSHIIIWMTIFNNRVVRLAEVWGFIRGPRFLRGGLWEVKVVLWCDTCLSTKDKWRQRWICRIRCFYFCCSSSSLLQTFQKHRAEEGNYFWDARASQLVFGRILSPKCFRRCRGTLCLCKVWIGFCSILVQATKVIKFWIRLFRVFYRIQACEGF